MTTQEQPDIKSVERLLGYFDSQVLAAYRNEPHKYIIESDFFEGELRVTNQYFHELEETGKKDEYVNIRFGYRTLKDGNLALVAWLPDLIEKSKGHVQRWAAFHLQNPEWTTDFDERFNMWVRRHLEGSWDVDNGPAYYIAESLQIINGLTSELVDINLFKHEIETSLTFPAAQNTHRYQDAHKELYGYLIDGLNKECISRFSSLLNRDVKVSDKNTVQSILKLFPQLETAPNFKAAINTVSEQRRLASHGVRPPASSFPAFEQFTKDLYLCLEALNDLITVLELELGVNAKQAYERSQQKKYLASIAKPPEPNYSICQAPRMVGKTVEKVEYGFRPEYEGVHQSEALIIYFTDGSIMSIDTGSNAWNLSNDENGLQPEDFHVDFRLYWVRGLHEKSTP